MAILYGLNCLLNTSINKKRFVTSRDFWEYRIMIAQLFREKGVAGWNPVTPTSFHKEHLLGVALIFLASGPIPVHTSKIHINFELIRPDFSNSDPKIRVQGVLRGKETCKLETSSNTKVFKTLARKQSDAILYI